MAVAQLQGVFKKAMEDPEHMEKMDKAGLAVKIMMGDEYGYLGLFGLPAGK
jgi:tripartite-type tricarboxylate transporter receptor subunit TctC